MQTEAELRANQIRNELETMERLIAKGLSVGEAIARECKLEESRAEAKRRYPGNRKAKNYGKPVLLHSRR